jgi:hypothetical protein
MQSISYFFTHHERTLPRPLCSCFFPSASFRPNCFSFNNNWTVYEYTDSWISSINKRIARKLMWDESIMSFLPWNYLFLFVPGFDAKRPFTFTVPSNWNLMAHETVSVHRQGIKFWKKISDLTHFQIKKTPWPQSASELYRPSDRRLSAKLVPTFCGLEGATWSAWRIPTAVFSDF